MVETKMAEGEKGTCLTFFFKNRYSRSPVERTAACNENNLCAWLDGYGCMRENGIKTHEFSLAEFLARLDGAYLDKVLKVYFYNILRNFR